MPRFNISRRCLRKAHSGLIIAISSFFSIASCSEYTFADRPTKVAITTDGDEFWSLPFPSDARKRSDGTYGLQEWPKANDFLDTWLEAADHFLTEGWGVTSGIFIPLDGPIDISTLPESASASLGGEASVFLLDVDPESPYRGQRIPVDVSIAPPDKLTPENLLAIIPAPGFVRRPLTTYAAVVTSRVRDINGEMLGRSRSFHDMFTEAARVDHPLAQKYGMLKATLTAESYSYADVMGAALFTTHDPEQMLMSIKTWTEDLDAPQFEADWVFVEENESYLVFSNSYQSPVIQADNRPYDASGEGKIVWNNGQPVIQGWQSVRLALTIPKSTQPKDGYPLTLYLHGSGGDWRQAIDRGPVPETSESKDEIPAVGTGPAEWLAQRGVATIGFDFPLHGERHNPPDTSGLVFYNLTTNPMVTVYNFHVAVMELLRLSRLILGLSIDETLHSKLDAGGHGGGLIRIDQKRLTGFGHSMGATLGVPWAAVDPRLKGILLSGSGGMLVEIASTATEPVDVNNLLSLFAGFDEKAFHNAHPMLHALQNMWDLIDPVAKAHRLAKEPGESQAPKDTMMTIGHLDGYFHPRAQAALAVALGAPLVGDGFNETLTAAMKLAERPKEDYPVRLNQGSATMAAVPFSAPHTLGHYVVFNQPEARFQYTCFLASVGLSEGSTISAPKNILSSCATP